MVYIKFHDGSADDSEFGRNLLNEALMLFCGKTLKDFEIVRLPGGKPCFKDSPVHFNISHTKNAAAVVISQNPAGVDIQHIVPYNPRLAQRICTSDELDILDKSSDKSYELCRMWAMRESYVKYTGEGMRQKIRDIAYFGKSHTYRIKTDYVLSVSPAPDEIFIIE